MDVLKKIPVLTAGFILYAALASAEIPEISFSQLSDRDLTVQGKTALSLNPESWKHTETPHFVYHFTDANQAETIYLHAEIQYEWIKEMFSVQSDPWKKKSHIFVFETEEAWKKFNTHDGERFLEFAGFTDGRDLYMHRAPHWLSPQRTLAHEITHIILFRFLGGSVPLAFNEGFAEFMATKAVAVQAGGNEYNIRILQLIPRDKYIPLKTLTGTKAYPEDMQTFYNESELFVRYLILNHGSQNFYAVLKAVSQGQEAEKALKTVYGFGFSELEEKFKTYAIKASSTA